MALDFLTPLQDDIYAHLSAAEFFADVHVLAQHKGVTESKIDEALSTLKPKAGKAGAAVVVLMPTLRVITPDLPGPVGPVSITVRVFVRTLVASAAGSGVGKTAEEIGLQVQAALHLWGNGACRLSADTEALVPYDQAPAGVTAYDVRLTTNETGRELAHKLAEPTIEVTAGVATITASEPAALLWYSLDGSYPSVAYTDPVPLSEGTELRARASLAGYRGSDIALFNA